MVTLYDKKTGKEVKVKYSIDAKEWLATGKYTDKKPVKQAPKQEEGK